MEKILIVYYSHTGNTQMMAESIAEGISKAKKETEAVVYSVSLINPKRIADFDKIAFGCPASGTESLEENEFEPFFTLCEKFLKGKKVALFGSYGWGGGPWMKAWEERVKKDGAELFAEGLVTLDTPGGESLCACVELGKQFAEQ